MANSSAMWQQTAHTPTNYHLLAAELELYKKA